MRLLARRSFLIGMILVGAVVLAALLAGWLAPFDPVKNNFRNRLSAPDEIFLLGTDRFGRDVLSRILFGAQVSLRIGLVVAVLSGFTGALIGLLSGWWRGVDIWLMRVMDGLMAFPGLRTLRLLLRHVLPACTAPLVVQQTYVFAIAILAEAVLSFVGVGPPPPRPTLGAIIADGRDTMVEAPWIALAPGVVIAMLVLGLNLLGDGLRDALDPRMRRITS